MKTIIFGAKILMVAGLENQDLYKSLIRTPVGGGFTILHSVIVISPMRMGN
jgi:hypothetical protein